jgi:hypothetical protein
MYRWVLDLEMFDYEIQVRPGKDHTNADTLSRIPCAGKICICEKVEEFERRSKTKIAQLSYSSGTVALTSQPTSRIFPIKFTPKWTPEELAKKQADDLDLGPVYKARIASDERPKCETYSMQGLFHRVEAFGNSQRRAIQTLGKSLRYSSAIADSQLQRGICKQVHEVKPLHISAKDHNQATYSNCALVQNRLLCRMVAQNLRYMSTAKEATHQRTSSE